MKHRQAYIAVGLVLKSLGTEEHKVEVIGNFQDLGIFSAWQAGVLGLPGQTIMGCGVSRPGLFLEVLEHVPEVALPKNLSVLVTGFLILDPNSHGIFEGKTGLIL